MQALFELELEIIDHRSWHSKFESTVINEVYAKGLLKEGVDISKQLEIVQQKVMSSIKQKVRSPEQSCYSDYSAISHIVKSFLLNKFRIQLLWFLVGYQVCWMTLQKLALMERI